MAAAAHDELTIYTNRFFLTLQHLGDEQSSVMQKKNSMYNEFKGPLIIPRYDDDIKVKLHDKIELTLINFEPVTQTFDCPDKETGTVSRLFPFTIKIIERPENQEREIFVYRNPRPNPEFQSKWIFYCMWKEHDCERRRRGGLCKVKGDDRTERPQKRQKRQKQIVDDGAGVADAVGVDDVTPMYTELELPNSRHALHGERDSRHDLQDFMQKLLVELKGNEWIKVLASNHLRGMGQQKYKGLENRVIFEIHDLIAKIAKEKNVAKLKAEYEIIINNFLSAACAYNPNLCKMLQKLAEAKGGVVAATEYIQLYTQMIVPFASKAPVCAQNWHRDHSLGRENQVCIAVSLDDKNLGTELIEEGVIDKSETIIVLAENNLLLSPVSDFSVGAALVVLDKDTYYSATVTKKTDKDITVKFREERKVDELITNANVSARCTALLSKEEKEERKRSMNCIAFAFDTYNIHRGPSSCETTVEPADKLRYGGVTQHVSASAAEFVNTEDEEDAIHTSFLQGPCGFKLRF